MVETLMTSMAGQPARRAAILFIAAIVLVAAALFPFAATLATPIPAFLPAFGAAVMLTELMTAYLLLAQFQFARRTALAWLAAGYGFVGLIVVPQMMVFPGVITPEGMLGAGSQTAIWLWAFWHCGFPLFVLAYVISAYRAGEQVVSRPATRQIAIAVAVGIPLLVTGLVALTTLGHDLLPVIIRQGSYNGLMTSGVGPAIWLLALLAFLAVLVPWRGSRAHLDLWLGVAMAAFLADVTLTLAGGARYSVGWYGARIGSVVSSGIVLAMLLRESTRLYAELAVANQRLGHLVRSDGLTGIANRRTFDAHLQQHAAQAVREKHPISLLMIDVDHFKKYNDRHGHPAGDECLRRVARAVADTIRRPLDLVARYGGEEFAAILPETNAEGAAVCAHAIVDAVNGLKLEHMASELGWVTVSVGTATILPAMGTTWSHLLTDLTASADTALYAAKQGGRNRWHAAPPPIAA